MPLELQKPQQAQKPVSTPIKYSEITDQNWKDFSQEQKEEIKDHYIKLDALKNRRSEGDIKINQFRLKTAIQNQFKDLNKFTLTEDIKYMVEFNNINTASLIEVNGKNTSLLHLICEKSNNLEDIIWTIRNSGDATFFKLQDANGMTYDQLLNKNPDITDTELKYLAALGDNDGFDLNSE
ncbi:MAG TPA: hypothetical protein QKA08_05140 [Candidatus Megaira endosymbiont of Nemacystus decipiens]|nr:hypothetical protein [Candidatus Megaera endosymbiont of Nemacystus decipiens]